MKVVPASGGLSATRRAARFHLYQYKKMLSKMAEYDQDRGIGRAGDVNSYIKGSLPYDPTGETVLRLEDAPAWYKDYEAWTRSIGTVYERLRAEDDEKGRKRGKSYIMFNYYAMEQMNPREGRARREVKLIRECHVSRDTIFRWMREVEDIVVIEAIQNNALRVM